MTSAGAPHASERSPEPRGAASEAAADEVADYARVSLAERAELNERVAARVRAEVSLLDC